MFRVLCTSLNGEEKIKDFADVEEAINLAEKLNTYTGLRTKVIDEYENTIVEYLN